MVQPATAIDAPESRRRPAEPRLGAMFSAHFDFVWRSLRRLGLPREAADDAAQQVFLVASRRLDDIVPGQERGFLFGIAYRTALDARRAYARRPDIPLSPVVDDRPDDTPDPEALLELRRRRELLDELLDALPMELRAVLVLYELEGMTSAEIAKALGVPHGTVASRIRRAKEEFQAIAKRHIAKQRSGGGKS